MAILEAFVFIVLIASVSTGYIYTQSLKHKEALKKMDLKYIKEMQDGE